MIEKYKIVKKIRTIYNLLEKFITGKYDDVDKIKHKLLELKNKYVIEKIVIGDEFCSINSLLEAIEQMRDVDRFSRVEKFCELLDIDD